MLVSFFFDRFHVGINSGDHKKDYRQISSNCCDDSDVLQRKKNKEIEDSSVMLKIEVKEENHRKGTRQTNYYSFWEFKYFIPEV